MHPGGCSDNTWRTRLKVLVAKSLPLHLTTPRRSVPSVVPMCKNPSVYVLTCVLSVGTLQIATTMPQEMFCNAACRFWPGRGHRRAEERGLSNQVSHLRR